MRSGSGGGGIHSLPWGSRCSHAGAPSNSGCVACSRPLQLTHAPMPLRFAAPCCADVRCCQSWCAGARLLLSLATAQLRHFAAALQRADGAGKRAGPPIATPTKVCCGLCGRREECGWGRRCKFPAADGTQPGHARSHRATSQSGVAASGRWQHRNSLSGMLTRRMALSCSDRTCEYTAQALPNVQESHYRAELMGSFMLEIANTPG